MWQWKGRESLFSKVFTTSYCVEIILQSDHPGGLWHHNLYRGGWVCVHECVCSCLGKCLLTRMNMLLHLMCIDRPVTSLFFSYLFVCLLQIHLLLLFYSLQTSAGKHATCISCHADNITCIECEYTFGRELVNVNANTNQQTKTKEHNMDPSLSQSHYTCCVCPLLWLELPLGHIMTASHFSLKGPLKLSAFGWKSTSLLGLKNKASCSDCLESEISLFRFKIFVIKINSDFSKIKMPP